CGVARSSRWPRIEKLHLSLQPKCACCGDKMDPHAGMQVHHIFPFHYCIALGRPDLELDLRNLITLCENEPGQPGENHHLLVGHLDAGIIVAVDPAMHNPTRFSRTVEFKDEHVEAVLGRGWYGWERERSAVRRLKPMPQESLSTEAILGFKPEFIATYVQLERHATGAASLSIW
ncbi:MAG: hypothetical protein JST54_35425, partial [Deltaproteobacteria bacterium]|nr:hypothetical protein [Deltaproteobacteria bacterium]